MPTATAIPTLPSDNPLRPLSTPAADSETPAPQNSNLLLSVSAPAVDLYECPQETCSIIGRLEQGMSLKAVSRTSNAENPWIEVEHQSHLLGWIKLDSQQLDFPHGLWDSLNLQQFIIATATP